MHDLIIPASKPSGYDFLALGALVTRLDPGIVPFSAADHYDLHVSGGEYNVAANLALCFGMKTAIASAMVDYPIGQKVASSVRAAGVDSFYAHFAHDGVRGPNIAQVWSDRGQGLRPPVVFYNRANEAASLLAPGSFDWKRIFSSGVRWFHSGGIFAALSGTTPELIIEGMREARAAGAIVSFDLNYRAKLWAAFAAEEKAGGGTGGGAGSAAERARATLARIVEQVDVLLGNEEDLQMGLGLEGPSVEHKSKLDPAAFLATIDQVSRRYPNVKAVATTLREVRSTNRHGWSAVLWIGGSSHIAPTCELDVYDRVGGGDGFAAGLIYGLLSGRSPEEALRLGWAHGALVTSFPGDTSMATVDQVEALARGGSARIQR
ncbi:MAG TPA: sugar kinase [Rectinemataceae bacterium]|nr:sugar kinase [Rectinemataceae bacterium]